MFYVNFGDSQQILLNVFTVSVFSPLAERGQLDILVKAAPGRRRRPELNPGVCKVNATPVNRCQHLARLSTAVHTNTRRLARGRSSWIAGILQIPSHNASLILPSAVLLINYSQSRFSAFNFTALIATLLSSNHGQLFTSMVRSSGWRLTADRRETTEWVLFSFSELIV